MAHLASRAYYALKRTHRPSGMGTSGKELADHIVDTAKDKGLKASFLWNGDWMKIKSDERDLTEKLRKAFGMEDSDEFIARRLGYAAYLKLHEHTGRPYIQIAREASGRESPTRKSRAQKFAEEIQADAIDRGVEAYFYWQDHDQLRVDHINKDPKTHMRHVFESKGPNDIIARTHGYVAYLRSIRDQWYVVIEPSLEHAQ